MNNNKIYSVSNRMLPYFEKICRRDKLSFISVGQNEYGVCVRMNVPNRRFKEVIEDCMCEIEKETYRSNIPVYSLRTLKDSNKLRNLMKINGKRSFHILKKDINKILF